MVAPSTSTTLISDGVSKASITNGVPKSVLIAGGVVGAAIAGVVVYYAYKRLFDNKQHGIEFYLELAEEKKKRGIDLFRSKDYVNATKFFKEAIQVLKSVANSEELLKRPTVKNLIAACNNNLSACCENLNDISGSIQYCTEAINIDPKYVKALRRRARIFEKCGKFESALDDYFTLTPLCTTQEEIIMINTDVERITQAVILPEMEKLMKEYENKHKEIPQYFIAIWLWNTVINDPLLKRCEQLKANNAKSYNETEAAGTAKSALNASLKLLNDGKYNEVLRAALQIYSQIQDNNANEEKKNLADFWTRCGVLLLIARFYYLHNERDNAHEFARRFSDFLMEADDATKASSEWVDYRVAYYTLKVLLVDTKEEIRSLVDEAAGIAPTNTDPLVTQAMRCLDAGEHQEALEIFKRVGELNPEHPYAPFYIHYLNYVVALKAQAVDQVRTHIYNFDVHLRSVSNPPAFAHILFTKVCMNSENLELALTAVKNVLKIMPNNAYALFLCGIMDNDASMARDPEKLRACVRKVEKVMYKVLEVDPYYWEPYRTLAKISLDKMNFDEALAYYEKAIPLARTREDLEVILKDKFLTAVTTARVKEGRGMPFLFPDAAVQPA